VWARLRRPQASFVLRPRQPQVVAYAVVSLGLVVLSLRSLNRAIHDVRRCMVQRLLLRRQQCARWRGPMSLFVIGSVLG